jgi:hypothetical protein
VTKENRIDILKRVPLTSTEAAKLLMVSLTSLYEYEREGWIKRLGQDQWSLVDVVQGRFRFLEDRAKRATQTATLSRVQIARAVEIEMRTAREAGQTIGMDDALAFVDDIVGPLMADLDGFSARCTREMELRRKIEAELNDVRTRHADRLDKAADILQTGGEADSSATEMSA